MTLNRMNLASPDGSVSKIYQHWADGDALRNTSAEWNNNILSDTKSDYFEGEVVPHVFVFKASNSEPLVQGQSYTINITYNHYQGNTNAGGFLYMTSPNVDRTPVPLAGAAPLPDAGGFLNGGGMLGNFNTVNANVTAVSGVDYTTGGNGTKDGHVSVTFTYTGPTTTSGNAEIHYGLMIAAPGQVPDQGKGVTMGATAWTGGSLQTTVDVNGSGAMSLQLAPSAILAGEISGMKFNDFNGDGVRDANGVDNILGTADDEPGLAGWTIFIDKDNDGTLDAGETSTVTTRGGAYSFSVTPDADPTDPDNDPYIIREVQQTGWHQTTVNPTAILITAADPREMNVDFGNQAYTPALNILKEATVPGGTANVAGEIIAYDITVQNTGNQTLSGVVVSDPFVSDLTRIADASGDNDGLLEVGETWRYSATHTVTQAEIDAGGSIVNVSTADSDQTPMDSDDASVPVQQTPGLNILKEATVPGGTADVAGEIICYDITVQNTGNQTLSGVTVSDPFVSDLTRIADASGDNDGLLEVGETWRYSATHAVTQAEIDAGVNIVNLATADSTQTDPDSDDASVPVRQTPGLNILKEASVPGGTADVAGEIIGYDITVQNTGNQTLSGVVVSDPFVSDLTRIADASGDNDSLLEVGETWRYSATHTVSQVEIDAGVNIVNLATADSTQTDPDSDDASVPVQQTPGLNILKEASVPGGTADVAGEIIGYDITVQNTGNQTLSGVVVSDPFVSDLTRIADASGDNDSLLEVGETWRYSATHTVAQAEIDAGGSIVNVSTADSDQTPLDSDDASVPVQQMPGLNILKEATVPGGTADVAGEIIGYDITVQNTGNQTLSGVVVSDPFVSDLTRIADASGDNDSLLEVGETWRYSATHTVTQTEIDAGVNIVNVSTADSDQTPMDRDDASIRVEQAPAIAVDKAIERITGGNDNSSADFPGDVLNYTVTVYNPGNVTLTNVTVVDPLTGLNVAGLSLAPGAARTYATQYVLTQADLDGNGGGDGYLDNTATVDSAQTDAASDSERVEVLPRPSLGINKTLETITGGNGNIVADAAGDRLNYTVTVSNEGNVTLTGVSVVDPLTTLNVSGLTLAPGDSRTYNTAYTLTQADIDSNGDGDGYFDNTVTADSDQTPALSDSESVPLLRTIGLGVNKSVTGVTGGNGNAFADWAGDVLNYAITVTNQGTVTLTNVSVVDLLTGFSQSIVSLAPGGSETYTTSYTLTQNDLDTNGNGRGYVENIAVVDSDQTEPARDNETVQLVRSPVLILDKAFLDVTGGNGNGQADAVGDALNYRITLSNPSNVTLTDVSVTEPLTGFGVTGLTLSPGVSRTYLTSYILQQSDLDNNGGGDGYIDNTATADSAQTAPVNDTESVPLLRSIGMAFDKQVLSINGGNGNNLVDAAGDVITYRFIVTNPGTVTLTGLTVVDPLTGLNESLASLAPSGNHVFTSTYTVTQSDLDTNAGGDGRIDNLATADSNETPSFTDAEAVTVVYDPRIDLVKWVSVDNGVSWEDANSPTGPTMPSGLPFGPLYKFSVTNTGNITLPGVSVTDSVYDLNNGDPGRAHAFGTMLPGATLEWVYTGAVYQPGQQSDIAVVTVAGMPTVTDADNAYYYGG